MANFTQQTNQMIAGLHNNFVSLSQQVSGLSKSFEVYYSQAGPTSATASPTTASLTYGGAASLDVPAVDCVVAGALVALLL